MPVQIEELVIRTRINKDCENEGDGVSNQEKDSIIRESVRQVMAILESKKQP